MKAWINLTQDEKIERLIEIVWRQEIIIRSLNIPKAHDGYELLEVQPTPLGDDLYYNAYQGKLANK